MSICEQILEKFVKKAIAIKDKKNKKQFSLQLQHYEAATLIHYLKFVFKDFAPDSLEYANLIAVQFDIDPQL